MVNQYTTFKGATSFGDTMLMSELENNLKQYLNWAFLNIGGFVNVRRPTTSSIDSGRFDVLRPSLDPTFTDGTVFESIRKDWVWETGVSYNGYSPIAISGVYVNNQFFGSGHATYGHYYDYANGRVIFSGAVPAGSGVSMEYSYRTVQVYKSDEATWFFEGQYQSYRPNSDQWVTHAPNSGDYVIPPSQRAQFPSIIIQAVPRGYSLPFELGNKNAWRYQDVIFNIVADTTKARNNLVDILRFEDDHTIKLFDTDRVVRSGAAPLDYRGMLINNSGMYPNLVDRYTFTTATFQNVNLSESQSLNPYLYEGRIRATMELILAEI